MNSSDSEYEGNDLSSNLNHESDSDFYLNPYIDSDGEIYYGDARPVEHIADWGVIPFVKSTKLEDSDITGSSTQSANLDVT